jgi:acetate---CoA ligase (ADP-forming)
MIEAVTPETQPESMAAVAPAGSLQLQDRLLANLHCLLNPRSVAIIGVSRNPDSFGYPLVEIAQRCGYAGALHLVNPKADSILGLPCHPSVLDILGEVDAAVIMTARKHVGAAVDDCIQKGVKGIVIISAGFAEQGDEGRREEEALVTKARAAGVRIIGPNTLGFFSAPASLDLIMTGFIRKGGTALITQSGNLTQSLTFPGAQRGLGFRYVVGLGNQAEVEVPDLIRYFREDPGTKVLAVHIEGLRDGRRFLEEVRATVPLKPVIVVKSGRTDKGARAASSHTAAMAGNDAIYQAAFRQCGAIPVEEFSRLASVLLAFQQGKPARGNRVCLISEGGGDCALASDECVRQGLELPELPPALQERLRILLPPNATVSNPIDLAGWENFVEATELVLAENSIDGVILVGGFAGNFHINARDYGKEADYVTRMCDLIARSPKPVLIYSYTGYLQSALTETLARREVPLFLDHHDAVRAMAALVQHERIRTRMAGRGFRAVAGLQNSAPGHPSVASPAVQLLEPVAKEILRRYELPCPPERLATNPGEAAAYAAELGYPVVLKIVSKDILHKSESGGVRLGLHDAAEVKAGCAAILENARRHHPTAVIAGVLVVRMDTEEGVEIILGGLRDPVFGPVVMFGLGGIFVEVLKDVAFRVCPIDEVDAGEMIREIGGHAVLTGVRGRPAMDLAAIQIALLQVSRLLMEHPEIAEIDLNPVKVHREGLAVLDARIITT